MSFASYSMNINFIIIIVKTSDFFTSLQEDYIWKIQILISVMILS